MARRYGPAAATREDTALAADVDELVRRLGGTLRGWRSGVVPILVGLVCSAGLLQGQTPAPEGLYEAGALRAAADGFGRRAELEPAVAAHWYNLGAAYYRLGAKGRATAAWIRARRLAPREATILRALRLTPAPDAGSARLMWSPPVTSAELLLLAAVAWLAGWAGWIWRPRARERWIVLLGFGGMAALGAVALESWYRRPIAVVLEQTTLRLSPHGRAPAVGPVEAGAAVRMRRGERGWLLVKSGALEGWVPSEAIAAIGG